MYKQMLNTINLTFLPWWKALQNISSNFSLKYPALQVGKEITFAMSVKTSGKIFSSLTKSNGLCFGEQLLLVYEDNLVLESMH